MNAASQCPCVVRGGDPMRSSPCLLPAGHDGPHMGHCFMCDGPCKGHRAAAPGASGMMRRATDWRTLLQARWGELGVSLPEETEHHVVRVLSHPVGYWAVWAMDRCVPRSVRRWVQRYMAGKYPDHTP